MIYSFYKNTIQNVYNKYCEITNAQLKKNLLFKLKLTPEIFGNIIEKYKFDTNERCVIFGLLANVVITDDFDDLINIINTKIRKELHSRVFSIISKNKTLTIEYIQNYILYDWDWYELSCNKSIATYENITKYKEFPWDKSAFIKNPHIPIEILLEDTNVDLSLLSMHPGVTIDIIMKELHNPIRTSRWNWIYLSCNPAIPIEIILEYSDYPWCFISAIKKYSNYNCAFNLIPFEFVISQKKLHKYIPILSLYCNITIEQIREYNDVFEFNWNGLTLNNSISFNDIVRNLDLPWVLDELHNKLHISIQDYTFYKHLFYKNTESFVKDSLYDTILHSRISKIMHKKNVVDFTMNDINHIVSPYIDELQQTIYNKYYTELYKPDNYEKTIYDIALRYVKTGKYDTIENVNMFELFDEINKELENKLIDIVGEYAKTKLY